MLTRELTLLALKGEVFDPQPFVDALDAQDAAIARLKAQAESDAHTANERIAELERERDEFIKDNEALHEDVEALQFARNQLTKAEAALREIACYNDTGANTRLEATGSYALFDEPGSVEAKRTQGYVETSRDEGKVEENRMKAPLGRTWAAELDSVLYQQVAAIADHYSIRMSETFKANLAIFCYEVEQKQDEDIQRKMREPPATVTIPIAQISPIVAAMLKATTRK